MARSTNRLRSVLQIWLDNVDIVAEVKDNQTYNDLDPAPPGDPMLPQHARLHSASIIKCKRALIEHILACSSTASRRWRMDGFFGLTAAACPFQYNATAQQCVCQGASWRGCTVIALRHPHRFHTKQLASRAAGAASAQDDALQHILTCVACRHFNVRLGVICMCSTRPICPKLSSALKGAAERVMPMISLTTNL